MIASMFLLISTRTSGIFLILSEALFLCVSFFSAGIRNYLCGEEQKRTFAVHLLCSFFLLELLVL